VIPEFAEQEDETAEAIFQQAGVDVEQQSRGATAQTQIGQNPNLVNRPVKATLNYNRIERRGVIAIGSATELTLKQSIGHGVARCPHGVTRKGYPQAMPEKQP
jgi:hypothetical protein